MGDSSDMADLDRFMRSTEGREHLEETVDILRGRRIVNVTFSNETQFIATTLHLDDGSNFFVFQPSNDLAVIREAFPEVLQREYFIDFSDRLSN